MNPGEKLIKDDKSILDHLFKNYSNFIQPVFQRRTVEIEDEYKVDKGEKDTYSIYEKDADELRK